METILKSARKTVVIGPERPTVLVGERINPTGKRRLAAALAEGDLEIIRQEALAQVEAGADVLDVNVGAAGVDEVDLLPKAVRLVMETVDVPVCIDTANIEALRAALLVHQEMAPEGKPLINSVNGEEARLEGVLPLVAEYGTAVIGLAMDDDGIPMTAEQRLRNAHKIVERAAQLGIPANDVIIDPLVLAVCADSQAARITLQTMRLIVAEFGVNITMGASNVSHGLPNRSAINAAFMAMAIASGLTCPIANPLSIPVREATLASNLLLGHDEWAMAWITYFRSRSK